MIEFKNWLNNNIGVLNVILFLISIAFGIFSGIFKSIIKKPKFKIRIIPKMTFGSTFLTGETYTAIESENYGIHKTAFVTYIDVTNIGTEASTIGKIRIGYYVDDGKNTFFKKRVWVNESSVLDDFGIPIATGKCLVTPNIRRSRVEIEEQYSSFLEIGDSKNGICYFEQSSSWGNYYPRKDEEGLTDLKIEIKDAFGNKFSKRYKSRMININEALRYNSKFGFTDLLLDKDPENFYGISTKADSGGKVN